MIEASEGGTSEWASEQRCVAAQWHRNRGTALGKLWAYFYSIGGDADQITLDAYLHEIGTLPPSQISLLAHAIREIDLEDPSVRKY